MGGRRWDAHGRTDHQGPSAGRRPGPPADPAHLSGGATAPCSCQCWRRCAFLAAGPAAHARIPCAETRRTPAAATAPTCAGGVSRRPSPSRTTSGPTAGTAAGPAAVHPPSTRPSTDGAAWSSAASANGNRSGRWPAATTNAATPSTAPSPSPQSSSGSETPSKSRQERPTGDSCEPRAPGAAPERAGPGPRVVRGGGNGASSPARGRRKECFRRANSGPK